MPRADWGVRETFHATRKVEYQCAYCGLSETYEDSQRAKHDGWHRILNTDICYRCWARADKGELDV